VAKPSTQSTDINSAAEVATAPTAEVAAAPSKVASASASEVAAAAAAEVAAPAAASMTTAGERRSRRERCEGSYEGQNLPVGHRFRPPRSIN
jgi:hypothetical protein